MDFSSWTRHLLRMKKFPIDAEKEDPVMDLQASGERRKHFRFSFEAPLEYWAAVESHARAGYTGNISETGLLIYSVDNLQVGTELNLLVLYANGYRLDKFEVVAKIVWKEYHYEEEWKGFRYGLQFVRISEEGRMKIREIIHRAVMQENNLFNQRDDRYSQSMEASP